MMAQADIEVGGRTVAMRATAATPRHYRIRFRRDLFADLIKLSNKVKDKSEEEAALSIDDLSIFENVAYVMAKDGDPSGVPDDIDQWLDQFDMFSIWEVLPQVLDLWNVSGVTLSSPKNQAGRLSAI
ncbi:MAG: hypothetical protein WAY93_05690 [Atopobiaceae bacterium]|jgi:hypothetical protein|nr:hypothetical protein [Atopobiaceae bacterium]